MHLCTLVFIYIYISLYSHILLSHVCIISFMHFYHDFVIFVLSIFLSCMILLIHISIYVPITRVLVLIIVLVIFYFALSFLAFTYFYHLFLACSIYSFRYIYHRILYSDRIHVSWLLHIAFHTLLKYDAYVITPYSCILILL